MLPKLYNKTLRNAVITMAGILTMFYTSFLYIHKDVRQHALEAEGLQYHRDSNFNPRNTAVEVYRYINGQDTMLGNSSGLRFHWDDWVDLSAADEILDRYRESHPQGQCDSALRNFADVDSYFIETYDKKVLRGMADLYCLKEIPSRIIAPTSNGYITVPVIDKLRIDYTFANTSKDELLEEFYRVGTSSSDAVSFEYTEFKAFQKEFNLDVNDFILDPDVEIYNMNKRRESLTEEEAKHLEFMEYANEYVDHAPQFFKYPWILDDLVAGHSHHFAYPFFKRYTADRERQSIIQHMIRAWFNFAQAYEIPSWVNYGSLLGWAYNGVNMPWDTDIDVQIPIVAFDRMARELNESLVLEDPRLGNSKYLLVVSPTYIRQGNGKNFIDARFIDINSGLYIDLTALSHSNFEPPAKFYDSFPDAESRANAIPVNCKHWNWHSLDELLPIRHTYFEGSSVYIPHNVSRLLSNKYGPTSYTTKLAFHDHNYQQDISMWVPDEICAGIPSTESGSRYRDPLTRTELTLAGACNNDELRDEYRIVRKYAARHHAINLDVDSFRYYDIEELGELPLFRKDAWDYHNDLVLGITKDFNWYHEV